MLGKNRRIIASILSVAVLATAIPATSVFAVETSTTVSTSTTTNKVTDITLTQLLYIPEGSTESNWNDTFMNYVEKIAADENYGGEVDKDMYQGMINIFASAVPNFKDNINEIYNADTTKVTSSFEDGKFITKAEVSDINTMVDDMINEQIQAAAGDYVDKIGQFNTKTVFDSTLVIEVDTANVEAAKTLNMTYKLICDGKEYTGLEIFDFASTKLGEVKDEFKVFFEDAKTKANAELTQAEADLKAAQSDLNDAQAKLDSLLEAGADTTEAQAEIDAAQADIDSANVQIADANEKLAVADEKAVEVDNVFARYMDTLSSMDDKVDALLNTTAVGTGSTADEAYSVFYAAIAKRNLPQAVMKMIPSTYDEFIASDLLKNALSTMKNISVADIEFLLSTASQVSIGLENGTFEVNADVKDAQGRKNTTLRIDASSNPMNIYFNAIMEDPDDTATTTPAETTPSETTTTTVSGDDDDDGTTTTTVSGDGDDDGTTTSETTGGDNVDDSYKVQALLGDVDSDDAHTAGDALEILKVVAGTSEFSLSGSVIGDVDYDGMITASDALRVLQVVAEINSDFADSEGTTALYVNMSFEDDTMATLLSRVYYAADGTTESPIVFSELVIDEPETLPEE